MEVISEAWENELLIRLRRVEGQVRGLQKMIEEQRTGEELLIQLSAAIAALRKVSGLAFAGEVQQLLRELAEDSEEAQTRISKLVERFGQIAP